MPKRASALLPLLLLSVWMRPTHAAPPEGFDLALADSGEVRFPAGALTGQDYLIAVYAEKPQDLSAVPPPDGLPGTLPMGCLPMAQISTASGQRRLSAQGEISFGCEGLPPSAAIFAFRGGQWVAIPTRRTQDGRVAAPFQETAVFGVFLPPENNAPRI